MATALDLGAAGQTGVASGPHAHWTVLKNNQRFPLSKARKDLGQYIQFRPPGQEQWFNLYANEQAGFKFNPGGYPGIELTSPMGPRNTGIAGASTDHGGEDYSFPEGTRLRFLGPGSVTTHAGRGNAGNVSSLRTGPYELQTLHLQALPEASTTRVSEATPESLPPQQADERTEDILKAFLYGANFNKEEPKKTLTQQLKETMVAGMLGQALNPQRFLSDYGLNTPYMQGFNAGSQDFFSGIFG